MDSSGLTIGFAFLAGLASFLSPCVFCLVPAYVGYLSGQSVGNEDRRANHGYTMTHGLAFVLGFSLVFIGLGAGASAVGNLLFDASPWLTRIGGAVVVIFGLHMTGLIRIPFLQYDLRRQVMPDRKWGYLSSGLMGVFFSAGWSPCVGPVLGAILTLSLNEGSVSQGVALLSAYSVGLAIPFLVAAAEISLVTTALRRFGKVMHYVEVSMGVVLIALGVLLASGRLQQISSLGFFFRNFDEILVGRWLLLGVIALALIGLIPALIARKKGRGFFDWWFFGAALFVVALPVALSLEPKEQAISEIDLLVG